MIGGGTEVPMGDEQAYLDGILREMNEDGRFKASVLVSAEGLPISSAFSP